MKRKTYIIKINGKHVATKYAWNSAVAQMRAEVAKVCKGTVSQLGRILTQSATGRDYTDGEWLWGDETQRISATITRHD